MGYRLSLAPIDKARDLGVSKLRSTSAPGTLAYPLLYDTCTCRKLRVTLAACSHYTCTHCGCYIPETTPTSLCVSIGTPPNKPHSLVRTRGIWRFTRRPTSLRYPKLNALPALIHSLCPTTRNGAAPQRPATFRASCPGASS